MQDFAKIKAIGALNVTRLLDHWGVEYKFISEAEIDFLNPVRNDKHFGSCRYNFIKDIGSDFAASALDERDFAALGEAFDKSDFNLDAAKTRMGFDIVGLTKMLFNCRTNADAANKLAHDLLTLNEQSPIATVSDEAIAQRKALAKHKKDKTVDFSRTLLEKCVSYKGTLGEVYLESRALKPVGVDKDIRYHAAMQHVTNGVKALFPALIFAIQQQPGGTVEGIHRIFLTHDGKGKANVPNPKMALGNVKGNAIWFGTPGKRLWVSEGPENALSLFCCGASFVACSINAGNLPYVTAPSCVETLIICADRDKAGVEAAKQALAIGQASGLDAQLLFPDKKKMPNGKWADFNDILRYGK